MEFKTKKFSKIIFVSIFALFVIATTAGPVLAQPQGQGNAVKDVLNIAAGPILSLAGEAAIRAVTGVIEIYVQVIGQVTVGIIGSTIALFQYNNFVNAKIVTIGWNLVRDITNMVFVIMFLVMAFYTVLGRDEYGARKFLVRLVIAAVAVNFSRTIAGVIIDFSQVVMLTFVNGFLAVAGGNFTQAFGINDYLNPESAVDAASILGTYIFGAILVTVTFFVILSMLVMLLARIIMLWLLIILSPFAFVASVLPGKIGSKASGWWEYFVNYNMAGPILAFFVWLTLYYMNYLQAGNWPGEGFIFTDAGDKTQFSSPNKVQLFFGSVMSTIMLLIGVKMAAGTKVFGANFADKAVGYMKKGAAKAGRAIGGAAGRGALRQTEGARLGMANFMAKIPGLRTTAFALRRGVQTARDKEEKKKIGNLDSATPDDIVKMLRAPGVRTSAAAAALREKALRDPRVMNQLTPAESFAILDAEKKRLRETKNTKGIEEVQSAEYKRLRAMSLDDRLKRREQLIARGAQPEELDTADMAIMDDSIARRKLENRPGGKDLAREMMRNRRKYAKDVGKVAENFPKLSAIEKESPWLIDAERRLADDYHYDTVSGTFSDPKTAAADRADLLSTFNAPDGANFFANFAGAAQTRGSAFIGTAIQGLSAGQIKRLMTKDDLTSEQSLAVKNLVDDIKGYTGNDKALLDKKAVIIAYDQYINGGATTGKGKRRRNKNVSPNPTTPPNTGNTPPGGGTAGGGAPPPPIIPPPPVVPPAGGTPPGGGGSPAGGAAPQTSTIPQTPTGGGGVTPTPTPAPSPVPTPAPSAPASAENAAKLTSGALVQRVGAWSENMNQLKDMMKTELEGASFTQLEQKIEKSREDIKRWKADLDNFRQMVIRPILRKGEEIDQGELSSFRDQFIKEKEKELRVYEEEAVRRKENRRKR